MKITIIFTLILSFIMSSSLVYAAPEAVNFITVQEYEAQQNGVTLLDVRSQNSRKKSNRFLPQAIWLDPNNEQAFADFVARSAKDTAYVIFCSCKHDEYSIRLAQQLAEKNFTHISVLKGGWRSLMDNGIRPTPLDPDKDCGCSVDWPTWPNKPANH